MNIVTKSSNDLKYDLIAGVEALGLIAHEVKIARLMRYMDLLVKWNKVYSLTAIDSELEIIKYHLLDGLTLVKYIEQTVATNIAENQFSILDVGSGMGIPGIILAIWYDNFHISVLDSNKKKTSFLRQVGIELQLNNLNVIDSRVEAYNPAKKYDVITSRAFADTGLFVQLSRHLLADKGYYLAMKSKKVKDELKKINGYTFEIVRVSIPFVADERFLVKITPND